MTIPSLVRSLLLVLLVTTGLTRAHATRFDYSYLFGDGLSVTGSFDGTENGGLVHGITDISLFINGVEAGGTVYAATFDDSSFAWAAGPVIGFDALGNNFMFANDDIAAGGFGYTSAFYLVNGTSFFDGAFALDMVQGLSGSEGVTSGSWSLTRSTAVPDASATAVLCALGLFPLMLFRRRVMV